MVLKSIALHVLNELGRRDEVVVRYPYIARVLDRLNLIIDRLDTREYLAAFLLRYSQPLEFGLIVVLIELDKRREQLKVLQCLALAQLDSIPLNLRPQVLIIIWDCSNKLLEELQELVELCTELAILDVQLVHHVDMPLMQDVTRFVLVLAILGDHRNVVVGL